MDPIISNSEDDTSVFAAAADPSDDFDNLTSEGEWPTVDPSSDSATAMPTYSPTAVTTMNENEMSHEHQHTYAGDIECGVPRTGQIADADCMYFSFTNRMQRD